MACFPCVKWCLSIILIDHFSRLVSVSFCCTLHRVSAWYILVEWKGGSCSLVGSFFLGKIKLILPDGLFM